MSEIPVHLCIGARELTEPRLSPGGSLLGFVVSHQGESWIEVHGDAVAGVCRVAEVPAPRPGRGLGGGCWCWTQAGDSVVYAAVDGNIWLQLLAGGGARRLTDHGPERGAQAPAVATDDRFIVYVVDQAEVWSAPLVGDDPPVRIDAGSADFCFDPVVSSDSATVAWQAWNMPDMPWDAAWMESVHLITGERARTNPAGSLQQPRPLPDGRVAAVRDDHGWLNVWVGDEAVVGEPYEHAGPTWGFGQRSYAFSPDGGRIAFTRNEHGFGRLCVVDMVTREISEVARGVHGQLSWEGDRLAAIRTGARTPTQVVTYRDRAAVGAWHRATIAVGPDPAWTDVSLVEPEAVEVLASDGHVVHARLYRADSSDGRLICWLHGGPTDQWQVTFMPRIAYWRSRGWNVLVPDHRGSTGHGREYQQALIGRWGGLDVDDIHAVLLAAHSRGWGDPRRTAMIGGSAGGFTVLGVLARLGRDDPADPLVAAAVVAYPVTDLAGLAERSHRFERHYTDTLVGPPESSAMRDHSPVWFADQIRRPLLVFHGEDDPVVPVAQSRVLAERMRAAGGEVELVVYPGEGHGFRDPAHQLDEYVRTEAFLRRHVA
jgi:dipeptidyl aminopeptidase/acylaminoacyl peptidase